MQGEATDLWQCRSNDLKKKGIERGARSRLAVIIIRLSHWDDDDIGNSGEKQDGWQWWSSPTGGRRPCRKQMSPSTDKRSVCVCRHKPPASIQGEKGSPCTIIIISTSKTPPFLMPSSFHPFLLLALMIDAQSRLNYDRHHILLLLPQSQPPSNNVSRENVTKFFFFSKKKSNSVFVFGATKKNNLVFLFISIDYKIVMHTSSSLSSSSFLCVVDISSSWSFHHLRLPPAIRVSHTAAMIVKRWYDYKIIIG